MVFQNYALYPHMTVAENMGFSLLMNGVSKQEIAAMVKPAAEILGLTNLLDRYPRQLSGGQRQRVAMGRAIVRNPQVFLFDEPLSNLDAKLRVQMRVEIKELHQRLKTTTVYVTHDQIEAMTMADKIVVMHDGIVEQIGAPLGTLRPAGQSFRRRLHRLTGHEHDRGTAVAVRPARVPHGGRDGLAARKIDRCREGQGPDLWPAPGACPPGREWNSCHRSRHRTYRFGDTGYRAARRNPTSPLCSTSALMCAPGETLHIAIDETAVHLFDKETGLRL